MFSRSLLIQTNFVLVWLVNLFLTIIPHSVPRCFLLRLCGFKIGSRVSIQRFVKITSLKGDLSIGDFSIIGVGVLLDNRRGIYISENVNISRECSILTLGHDISTPSFPTKGGSVYLHKSSWLFMKVAVMPNVCVGENSVILPFSVLTKNAEAYKIYGGVPAVQKAGVVPSRSKQGSYRYILGF